MKKLHNALKLEELVNLINQVYYTSKLNSMLRFGDVAVLALV